MYLPPAGVDDFSRARDPQRLREQWHATVSAMLTSVRDQESGSPLFYDQLADTSGIPDGDPQGIPWNGFPLRLTKWHGGTANPQSVRNANAAAEMILRKPVFGLYREDGTPLALPFRVQDEYCEWHTERDATGIRRISFTCEPPEYWEFLAREDRDLVHLLYEELLHRDIPKDDLGWPFDVFERGNDGRLQRRYAAGDYNPWNVWNTERGAIHLTHPANSLFAEMYLASDGTLGWPVEPDASGEVDEIGLMCCAGAGGINRSSDPLILRGVFKFARTGRSVALANPIGLYISPFELGVLLDPEDNPLDDALSFPRRSQDSSRILRAEIAAPEGASFTLDRCTLDGTPLQFGGQIARGITMRLFGVAKTIPGRRIRRVRTCPQFCCTHPTHPLFRGTFRHADVPDGCGSIQPRNWELEAYDIPPDPSAFAERDGRDQRPLKPRGRAIHDADRRPTLDLEPR